MALPGGYKKALILVLIGTMAVCAGSASATLPGKSGPLLISTFIKDGSPNYSTYLYSQPLAGKPRKLLGSTQYSYSNGAVSPNGRQLVFARYPGYQLWLGPLSNPGKAKAITELDPDLNNGDPVFSPDGRFIYYSATYYTDGVGWHLRRYDIKSGKIKNYEVNHGLDWGLTDISTDGRLLAYHRGNDDHKSKIRFLDLKTGKSWNFKFKYTTGGASFAPDGRSIVFAAGIKERFEIFTARLDGKGARRLTDNPKINYQPVFAPDGKQVAYTQGSGSSKKIGVINLKTGKTKFIKVPGDYTKVEQWLDRK